MGCTQSTTLSCANYVPKRKIVCRWRRISQEERLISTILVSRHEFTIIRREYDVSSLESTHSSHIALITVKRTPTVDESEIALTKLTICA